MDNNKETLATDVTKQSLAADATNPIVPPPQPQVTINNTIAPAPEGSSEQSSSSSKKMIIMLIVGVVVVLLAVVGIYMYLSRQQPIPESQVQETTTTQAPSSIAQIRDALEQELDSIEVEASEGEFKSVDEDLQSL